MLTNFIGRLLFVLASLSLLKPSNAQDCERLQASLTYTQEEAPRDLSGVLPVVVQRINQVLDGVVDVQVEWTGADLHGRVGEHEIQAKVTRHVDESAAVVTQCFHVPFRILDTNECLLPAGHWMRHKCHGSSICINTIGSYECMCPSSDQPLELSQGSTVEDKSVWMKLLETQSSAWEVSFSSSRLTSCPSLPSTYGCCSERRDVDCRAAFRCPQDPCAKHDCVATAECIKKDSPTDRPNYTCQCPPDLMGNGKVCTRNDAKPAPKVMYDGVTPTDETVRNNFYCDCTPPVVDACSGFPPCAGKHQICQLGPNNAPHCGCQTGYVWHDTYGCVDKNPPVLRLKNDPEGDQTLRLHQGDIYKEYAVEIQDENAEEYMRSLKIAYSQRLPHGCFATMGNFHVNYTVATPWTSPPYVQVTRRVIIDDIDECSLSNIQEYESTCPALVPQCDMKAGAKCVNTRGSYTCQCPAYTTGDGFIPNAQLGKKLPTPQGYQGGTGCTDTSKPVIALKGPNPKVFPICSCGGIQGVMMKSATDDNREDLQQSQQQYYEADIKEILRRTVGAELCATTSNPNPQPKDCVSAYDQTYNAKIDLTSQVRVGEPVQKSALHWAVPYDVSDAAGNAAVTVWRDVIVEEVDLHSIVNKETDITAAVNAALEKQEKAHQLEMRNQVAKAVEEERKRKSGGRKSKMDCPACPKCSCAADETKCEAYCQQHYSSDKQHQCDPSARYETSWMVQVMVWIEEFVPAQIVPTIATTLVILFGFMVIQWLMVMAFGSGSYSSRQRTFYPTDEREREFQNAVSVLQSPPSQQRHLLLQQQQQPPLQQDPLPAPQQGLPPSSPAPFYSPQFGGSVSSPPPSNGTSLFGPNGSTSASVPRNSGYNDIYASPPIITPRRRQNGAGFTR